MSKEGATCSQDARMCRDTFVGTHNMGGGRRCEGANSASLATHAEYYTVPAVPRVFNV